MRDKSIYVGTFPDKKLAYCADFLLGYVDPVTVAEWGRHVLVEYDDQAVELWPLSWGDISDPAVSVVGLRT